MTGENPATGGNPANGESYEIGKTFYVSIFQIFLVQDCFACNRYCHNALVEIFYVDCMGTRNR